MIWIWLSFIAFVLSMLALDLGVFHRKAHVVSVREALAWSAVWVALGLSFSAFIYFAYEGHWMGLGTTADAADGIINDGSTATVKYLTGYIVEKSLSVDNVFVIAMLFGFFAVPAMYQHRVLFWGILGALVMRGAMIALGAKLITTICSTSGPSPAKAARLRLMNTTARHDLPADITGQRKLAYLLGHPSADVLLAECEQYMRENRQRFDRLFRQAAGD